MIEHIEPFCAAKGLSDREFSILAVSPKFMSRLRRGMASLRSLEAAAEFINQHENTPGAEIRLMLERSKRAEAA